MTFITFSRYLDSATGQIFVFMIMAVAAVEVAVGLALLVWAYVKAGGFGEMLSAVSGPLAISTLDQE